MRITYDEVKIDHILAVFIVEDELSVQTNYLLLCVVQVAQQKIMHLVPVFTPETNNQTNNECLSKFVQTHNASSSMKTAIIFGASRSAGNERAPRGKQRHLEIFIHNIQHTLQPQSQFNFSLISSKSIKTSDSKNCLGFEIDADVELRQRVESQCLYLIT